MSLFIFPPVPCWMFAAWQLIRVVHSFADLTVVTSPQIYSEFVHQHHIPRCSVWQKGIDTVTFHPNHRNAAMRRQMMGLAEDSRTSHKNNVNETDDNLFLMVYIGRLGAEKRLAALRDMLDRLTEHYSHIQSDLKNQVRLCIVGDGPQRHSLEQCFQKYIQEGIVTFMGVLRGTELSQAYASSDVFVLPSDSETLGFVVMESMASGVPVIGVNAGGVPDLIDHNRTGFLVDHVNDIATFTEYILQLKDDVRLRNEISKCSRMEMERWSWTSSMMKLVNQQYTDARNNFHSRFEQRILRLWRRYSRYVFGNQLQIHSPNFHDVPVRPT
jgi:sulfoquinovosyltransferase